ncbi:unnamed protein product [Meloidogyne enterolobii]|uniref:Uncharacterized protein n=1 Tax=Meloidogyne enterolobii TaxID=390850 RepID=A0ACB1AWL4_MELEN
MSEMKTESLGRPEDDKSLDLVIKLTTQLAKNLKEAEETNKLLVEAREYIESVCGVGSKLTAKRGLKRSHSHSSTSPTKKKYCFFCNIYVMNEDYNAHLESDKHIELVKLNKLTPPTSSSKMDN